PHREIQRATARLELTSPLQKGILPALSNCLNDQELTDMANEEKSQKKPTPTAAKRAKTSAKRNLRNRIVRSDVFTHQKNVLEAIKSGDKEAAVKANSLYASRLDKAVKKGTIKKNNASRKKSRMALAIGKMA
ncbi:MAG: 30S ribosomal protein S20, partial [Kiritimatiellia bacterium]|nr:30S ribosomal protein S20 [Kiritimatiellia bacterium]